MKPIVSLKPTLTALTCFCLVLFFHEAAKAQSRPWNVPNNALALKNPYSGDAQSISQGKALYVNYCSPCHGKAGKGDGPAAAALNPKPANHTLPAIQQEPDGSLFYKISEGRTPMPTYKASLTEAQRWALVNYIKTLGKKS